jgi:hypothetical protein
MAKKQEEEISPITLVKEALQELDGNAKPEAVAEWISTKKGVTVAPEQVNRIINNMRALSVNETLSFVGAKAKSKPTE